MVSRFLVSKNHRVTTQKPFHRMPRNVWPADNIIMIMKENMILYSDDSMESYLRFHLYSCTILNQKIQWTKDSSKII